MIISILWQPGPSKGGIQCKQKRIGDRESVRGTGRESKSPHQSHLPRGQGPPIQPLQRRPLPRIAPWMTPTSWALLAPEPGPVYHEGSYRMTRSLIHTARALLSLSLAVLPAVCPVWSNRLRPQSRTLWPTATSVDKRRRFLPAHLMASPFPPLAEVSMAFRPSSACADTPYSRTQGKRRCQSQQTHVSLGGQAPWPGYLSILRHTQCCDK